MICIAQPITIPHHRESTSVLMRLFFLQNSKEHVILCEPPTQKPLALENILGNCQASWSLERCQILRAAGLAHDAALTDNCWIHLCHNNYKQTKARKKIPRTTKNNEEQKLLHLITFPFRVFNVFHILIYSQEKNKQTKNQNKKL